MIPAASTSIWRLNVKSNSYLTLIPHDLNFFRNHFDGRQFPLAEWTPPPITISGKSKKLPDVVGWMVSAPVLSDRAKNVLEPIVKHCVQFLPFHRLRKTDFYAMNVLCIERSLLDVNKSKIFYDVNGSKPLGIDKAVFREVTHELPPIFKLGTTSGSVFGEIYVTRKFADAAITNKLTGFELAAPEENSLDYVLSGRPQNVVPGIVG